LCAYVTSTHGSCGSQWLTAAAAAAAAAAAVAQIRKLFNLTKDDDVRKYVNTYRRTFEVNGKKHSKAPKIQRLVTPETLQVRHAQHDCWPVRFVVARSTCIMLKEVLQDLYLLGGVQLQSGTYRLL
jgi:hypothetical protein